MKYSIIILTALALISFTGNQAKYPGYLEKKITKEIKRVFEKENIRTTLIDDDLFSQDFNMTDIFLVKSGQNLDIGYVAITLASACKIGGCTIGTEEHFSNMSEEFYFMTIYDMNRVIRKMKILEYDATYGYEIAAKSWLKQFVGKVGGSLVYNEDIDGISGATISVKSLIDEINEQDLYLSNLVSTQ